MVRLREIPRTAAFAWSPGANSPLVVTGTRAGAVDADFSDETKLELWDLSLDNVEQGLELQPIASISTDSRCVSEEFLQIFESDFGVGFMISLGHQPTVNILGASSLELLRMGRSIFGMPKNLSKARTDLCRGRQNTVEL